MPSLDILSPKELSSQLNSLRESICEDVRCEVRHALEGMRMELREGLEGIQTMRQEVHGKGIDVGRRAPSIPDSLRRVATVDWAQPVQRTEEVPDIPGVANSHLPSMPEDMEDASDKVFPMGTVPPRAAVPPVLTQKTASTLPGQVEPFDQTSLISRSYTTLQRQTTNTVLSEQSGRRYKSRFSGRMDPPQGLRFRRLQKLVRTLSGSAAKVHRFNKEDFIEISISLSIVLNGLFLGLQADHMARNNTETLPMFFIVSETVFCAIFTLELIWKLAKFRSRFFCVPAWRWNVFDTILVSLQLGDVLVEILFQNMPALETASTMKNAAFVRLLRLLRLLRILRMLRLLQFFSELNVVTSAIYRSLRSLFGAVVMLLMVMYIIGIVFTQITTSYRLALVDDGLQDDSELVEWWGNLSRSMLTLYEAFLGGVDWDSLVRPLIPISPWMAIAFTLYMAFITLAMMNVITGIFVESAMKNAEFEKNKVLTEHVRELAAMLTVSDDGFINKEDFRTTLKDQELQIYFRDMGIDSEEVLRLLDMMGCTDDDDGVEVEALVQAMARLREGAKFLDVMTMLYEVDQQYQSLSDWLIRTDTNVARLSEHILGMCLPTPPPKMASKAKAFAGSAILR
mmetsp:Transcript_20859/g.58855  ORF Transcript_20859/g.58855 Transcript_20859/m.58855 type:complete len:625 (+) Transcript_20859:153-2027(+)